MKVRISAYGKTAWENSNANPHHLIGEAEEKPLCGDMFCWSVKWENGEWNEYRDGELEEVRDGD